MMTIGMQWQINSTVNYQIWLVRSAHDNELPKDGLDLTFVDIDCMLILKTQSEHSSNIMTPPCLSKYNQES